jgi:hypothetical protein
MAIALAITHDILVGSWQRLLRQKLNSRTDNPLSMITRIFPLLFVVALSSCASETESTETPTQGSTPATAQPAEQGTKVNVGSGGVSVDSDKGSVQLSGDSASISLP